ncbi:hypothetical protein QE393_001661 [Pseudomonas sp. SORGH_AS 211]|uniref:hypothetical protein n=1 Tax=Pseudomonas sp. SORGH_AS_0211 TaxID=3041796 RepID=UPI002865E344|nr:hypothetical protein [Pseudomonas sp. SORGH_AS_0211]MDR6178401.1 hypothetical protein [Pseudomonas sp. SORGH_AS_0211]
MPSTLSVQIDLPPELAESYANWLQSRVEHTIRQHQWEPRFTRIEDWTSRRTAILRRYPPLLAADQTATQIRAQLAAQEAN